MFKLQETHSPQGRDPRPRTQGLPAPARLHRPRPSGLGGADSAGSLYREREQVGEALGNGKFP